MFFKGKKEEDVCYVFVQKKYVPKIQVFEKKKKKEKRKEIIPKGLIVLALICWASKSFIQAQSSRALPGLFPLTLHLSPSDKAHSLRNIPQNSFLVNRNAQVLKVGSC